MLLTQGHRFRDKIPWLWRGDCSPVDWITFRWHVLFLFILTTSLPITGYSKEKPSSPPVIISGPTMGTRYNIKIPKLPEGIGLEHLKQDIDAVLERVNNQMSAYRKSSEVSRFNRST